MKEIVLDTETTGLDPYDGHKIIEIGCVELVNKVRTGRVYHTYINPKRDVPQSAFAVHGISTEFLTDKKTFKEVVKDFLQFIKGGILIIHNARFDLKFLNKELDYLDMEGLVNHKVIDTLLMARKMFPGSPASLDALCKKYKIDLTKREKHGALLDAELLADVYINLTGGNQEKLTFGNNNQNENIQQASHITNKKNVRPPRKWNLTSQEIENHEKFMKRVKSPVWKDD